MKKQIIKNILIIVLGVFIIIPLISMIFNIDFSRQEGFVSEESDDVTLTNGTEALSIIPYDFGITVASADTTVFDPTNSTLTSASLSDTGDIKSNLTYTSGTSGAIALNSSIPIQTLTYGETLTLTINDKSDGTGNDFKFSNKLINYPFSIKDSGADVTSIDLNNYNVGDTIGTITLTDGTDITNYNYSLTDNTYFEIDGLSINVKDRTLTTTPYPLTITRTNDSNSASDIPLTFNITITAADATESTTTETTTTYLDSTNMHRVDISGVKIYQSTTDTDVSYTGLSDEFLYCPAGEIYCSSGTPNFKTSYTLPNGQTSNTYGFYCLDSNSAETSQQVECSGNRLADGQNITLMSNCLNSLGNTTTNKYYGLTNTSTTTRVDGGVRVTFEDKTEFKGFTDPFKYIPFEISGNNAYVYDTSQALLFTSDNCGIYENDDCFEEVTASCDDTTSSSDGTCPEIKCLADNGSEKGGPLCCGQSGVLQNTKYNCPADYPFCVGYKCGESWGTCQATAS